MMILQRLFSLTARCKAELRNPYVSRVKTGCQKQGLLRQKNVGHKNAAHLFALHFSAHNLVVRQSILAR
jgi:hypothetical protein